MLQKICRQSFRYVTCGDEQTVHLTLSRELMTICLLNSHPHPYPYPWCYPYPRFSNASMIRQELVPKDLIQKGERHKTIVQKKSLSWRREYYKLSIQCSEKIKNRKTRRPDSIVTDLYFSLLRTSQNFESKESVWNSCRNYGLIRLNVLPTDWWTMPHGRPSTQNSQTCKQIDAI